MNYTRIPSKYIRKLYLDLQVNYTRVTSESPPNHTRMKLKTQPTYTESCMSSCTGHQHQRLSITLCDVLTLRVATTKASLTAGRRGMWRPCLCRARTTSLKGGLRPERRASLLSVTVRSGSTTRPRCKKSASDHIHECLLKLTREDLYTVTKHHATVLHVVTCFYGYVRMDMSGTSAGQRTLPVPVLYLLLPSQSE